MKQQITNFWDKNKVFILGLLSAVVLSFQQFENRDINLKAIAFAGLIATAGYLGREWHGQGLSITGIIGNAAYVFTTLQQQNSFTWPQFILQTIILIVTLAAPDPKSRTDQTPIGGSPDNSLQQIQKS